MPTLNRQCPAVAISSTQDQASSRFQFPSQTFVHSTPNLSLSPTEQSYSPDPLHDIPALDCSPQQHRSPAPHQHPVPSPARSDPDSSFLAAHKAARTPPRRTLAAADPTLLALVPSAPWDSYAVHRSQVYMERRRRSCRRGIARAGRGSGARGAGSGRGGVCGGGSSTEKQRLVR